MGQIKEKKYSQENERIIVEGPRRSRRDVVIRRPSHEHHQTKEGEGENLEIWG